MMMTTHGMRVHNMTFWCIFFSFPWFKCICILACALSFISNGGNLGINTWTNSTIKLKKTCKTSLS
jgi:hypothetical protein